MAVPAETTSLNFSGKYQLNKSLSDDTDKILQLQGIGWMTRKAIGLATLYVNIKHTTENGVETLVNAQELTGGVGSNTETRLLDWQDRKVPDKLFGPVVTKSRRAKADDLEHDYLKQGWTAHSLEHGVVNTIGVSDTPESGRVWVAEMVWDIEEVNGERRYVKRIFFTGPNGEELTARQVFDYLGPI